MDSTVTQVARRLSGERATNRSVIERSALAGFPLRSPASHLVPFLPSSFVPMPLLAMLEFDGKNLCWRCLQRVLLLHNTCRVGDWENMLGKSTQKLLDCNCKLTRLDAYNRMRGQRLFRSCQILLTCNQQNISPSADL